ncbi:MAG: serine protease [Treponema sp.]|nr:serine protease [Treponema sp.]MCL2251039.1 serine protease [Treponema sp.]
MKSKLLIFIPILVSFFVSCSSFASNSGSMSPKTLDLVQNAVFEVVVEKPTTDKTVYDRELNWDNVPFVIKNDKYYSIGTAFAISKNELITAFHVINLGLESIVYDKYFVRDSKGDVFEIDRITGGSREKDFLVFTVKDRTFTKFFQFERNYKIGDAVLSIGNALGEGIVVRNGLVLGTVPEEDSGRWVLLKSSADGNPGNSGGPLVTPNGKVVALVTSLRDNILYSVPTDVLFEDDRTILTYRARGRFGHLILANKFDNIFETSVPIPNTYTEVRKKIRADYIKNYDFAMSSLFKEAPEYLTGPNNVYLLNSTLSSSFPEVSFIDPNDDNWKLSNFNSRSYQLENDGRLAHIGISGYNFYKIKKPNNVSLENACTNPKYIMDLILHNIRIDRTLWGSDRYRILSFGEPAAIGQHQDNLGRTWIKAHWVITFDDKVQIMYILPLPDGPIVLTTIQDSNYLQDFEWDLKKLCDHVFVAFLATFKNWTEYLSMEKYIPSFFKEPHKQGLNFNWNDASKSFSFDCHGIRINADNNVFDWTGDSELFIAPTWYKNKEKLEYGIRKVTISRDLRGNDFFVVYRNLLPDQRLGSKAMESWNDLVQEKFPFDGTAAISVRENTGSVGGIIKPRVSGTRLIEPMRLDTLFSLYFAMENPQNEDNLNQRFNALMQAISVEE